MAKIKRKGKEERNRKKMRRKRKKPKKERKIEVRKIAKKYEIWDKEEKAAKLKVEIRKLVSEKFHK